MITGDLELDGERFYVLGVGTIVTRELVLRKKLELRSISCGSLLYMCLALGILPPNAPSLPPVPKGHHLYPN